MMDGVGAGECDMMVYECGCCMRMWVGMGNYMGWGYGYGGLSWGVMYNYVLLAVLCYYVCFVSVRLGVQSRKSSNAN